MESMLLAASFALVLAPAFAADAVDHATRQLATISPPAPDQSMATTAATPVQAKPNGMMTCPMPKGRKTIVKLSGMTMPNGMSGGTMEKSQMAQCPIMKPPSGTAVPPRPPSTSNDAHRHRLFF